MADIRLYQGDLFEECKRIKDNSIDAIITDLPYGTTACAWDAVIPFGEMWDVIKRVLKPNAPFITTSSQPFTSALVMSNPSWFKYEWIYQKIAGSNFAQARYQPMKEHESVLVFCDGRANYYPIKEPRKGSGLERTKYAYNPSNTGKRDAMGGFEMAHADHNGNNELRYPSSVQIFNNRAKGDRGLHPTQKPVSLYEYLVKTYTLEGQTVLDFCAGSFTTAVACDNTNRNWICMEKEEKYCKIGLTRINDNRERLSLPLLNSIN